MSASILFKHILNNFITCNTTDRVALVSSTPTERVSTEEVLDVLTETNCGERKVRTRETLGTGEDIGNDTIISLEGEHFTTSTKTNHDFVHNEEDAILVTESTDALNNLRRVNKSTSGTSDRFDHNSSNTCGIFIDDDFFKVGQVVLHCFGLTESPLELESL